MEVAKWKYENLVNVNNDCSEDFGDCVGENGHKVELGVIAFNVLEGFGNAHIISFGVVSES